MKKITYGKYKNVISKKLKALRKNKYSQKALAAQMQLLGVNIDQQMISRIENNKRFVTDYELVCFSKILGVDEKELLKDFTNLQEFDDLEQEIK